MQVAGDYDVIVNCTGVGARHLVNDAELEPMKGQLIKVSTFIVMCNVKVFVMCHIHLQHCKSRLRCSSLFSVL